MTQDTGPQTVPSALADFVIAVRPDWAPGAVRMVMWDVLYRGWPWPRVALALVRAAFAPDADHPRVLLDTPELRHPDLFTPPREPATPEVAHTYVERIRRMLQQGEK